MLAIVAEMRAEWLGEEVAAGGVAEEVRAADAPEVGGPVDRVLPDLMELMAALPPTASLRLIPTPTSRAAAGARVHENSL